MDALITPTVYPTLCLCAAAVMRYWRAIAAAFIRLWVVSWMVAAVRARIAAVRIGDEPVEAAVVR